MDVNRSPKTLTKLQIRQQNTESVNGKLKTVN